MSIRITRTGRYIVDYYPHGRKGKRIQRLLPKNIKTREEALKYENILRGTDKKKKKDYLTSSISSLFPKYLDWYKNHRAETTYIDIKGVWDNHLIKHLGSLIADNLEIEDIDDYKKKRKKEGGTAPTINKELSYFSGFLCWSAKRGYIRQKQFIIEKLPYKRPKPQVLSFEEVIRIILNAEPFYRVFFLCLYTIGLRFDEARNLCWENIDLINKLLKVKQKGGSEKILPIPNWLYRSFIEINPKKKGYVFINKKTRKPIVDIRKALARACKKAQITKRVYPHLFRHSLATHLLGKGINLETIKQYLGHTDIKSTEFYTHVAIEHLREASKEIDYIPEKRCSDF